MVRTYDEYAIQFIRSHKTRDLRPVLLRDQRIMFIGEAVEHCLALYRELDVPLDRTVRFEIQHRGLAKMELGKWPAIAFYTMIDPSVAISADADVSSPPPIEMPLGELQACKGDVVYGVVRDLLAVFRFTDLDRAAFDKVDVDAKRAEHLKRELKQALDDLGLGGQLRLE